MRDLSSVILYQLNMAEVMSRGHLCSLKSSDSFQSHSWRVSSVYLVSSAQLRRNSASPRTARDHVTSPSPASPPSCFLGYRSKYLGQSPISRTAQIFETWSVNWRGSTCLRSRCGGGVNRSSLMRPRGEAAAESSSARSETRGAWEGAISFKSRADRATEDDGERWTQSSHSEAAIQPQIQLSSIQQDVGIACLVLVGAFLWVRLFHFFTSKHILGQKLSRKIVHITSGLFYMLCWPFFSASKYAPFIAGLVPLANGIRLTIYGSGLLKDEGLVKSMSRSGESRELLRGPLYYVMVLYLSTVLFWRQSPVGMIALSMMCAGDGIADIIGRKYGSKKLPYNSDKSFAGSIAMFLFGFLVSFLCVYYFTLFGFFELDWCSTAVRLALISLIATFVESLPITTRLDDNFTVPVTTFLLGIFFFP